MRVPSRKFRILARVTALVLLAWTAIDLTATQLCPTDGMVPAVAVGKLAPAGQQSPPPVPSNPTQASHVDDCFCCSHCVNVAVPETVLLVGTITACESVPDVRIPFADGHPLDHPPQLSQA